MSTYDITVTGCDDSTTIQLALTNREFEFIHRVAEATTDASSYDCKPRMSVLLADQIEGN